MQKTKATRSLPNDARSLRRVSRPVEIIGVALGSGARDTRCSLGPAALHASGIAERLQRSSGRTVLWNEILKPVQDAADALTMVHEICGRLAWHVQKTAARRRMPVVVGGDHSCAIGTWSGVARSVPGKLGLIWIDAHMDAHTPETTLSGALHGMPLACLLGHGDPRLVGLTAGHHLAPQHLCLIGVRSFESGEALLLARLGVRIMFIDEVVERGIDACIAEALAIATGGTAGFGVSLDLDAIDPEDAPGVGSPVEGGLAGDDAVRALALLHDHPALKALEVVEYNPALDTSGATARLVRRLMETALGARRAAELRRRFA
jgi:arginase